MGKRITLSRPRMLGSFADESVDRAFLFESPLRVGDTGDFFPDGLRVTVDDDVVTSVVVETVSTRGVAICAGVDEAAAVELLGAPQGERNPVNAHRVVAAQFEKAVQRRRFGYVIFGMHLDEP